MDNSDEQLMSSRNLDDIGDADDANWGGLEALPGHPIMWVLILSELVVFGALLLTSGLFAVFAVHATKAGDILRCRLWLLATSVLGMIFLIIKFSEYMGKFDVGIGLESSTFFTLYFLITGFHALHVVMGLGVLGVVAIWPSRINIETGTAFWHMIDMVWVLVFPVIYLVR